MASNGININTREVDRLAESIRASNNRLNSQINDISRSVREIKAMWDSPTGDKLASKYAELIPVFTEYKKKIEEFARFLNITVDVYEVNERRIERKASRFT